MACALAALVAGGSSAQAQTVKKRPTPTPKPSVATAPGDASPAPGTSPSFALPDVVATVNGEPIKGADLQRTAQTLVGDQGKDLNNLPSESKRQVYVSVLGTMIDDKLIAAAAATESVDDIQVEKRYAALVAQYPNPAAFDAQVKKAGETPEKIKASVRLQLAQQQWLEKLLAPQTVVSPQEVERFYKEGPTSKFDQPETVHAEQILVPARRDAAPEVALAAEDKAKALEARVKAGEDFSTVAKDATDDPAKPANNVDLGYFSQDRIMPELGAAAFKMKVGEVSGPVQTQFGYHILKVLDRKTAHTATLDEARPAITAYLTQEKRQKAEAALLAELREKAKIETFLSGE